LEDILQLIREAELSLFFMNGTGIGALLLFFIAITALMRFGGGRIELGKIANAFRRS
jgi:hypothetical protein